MKPKILLVEDDYAVHAALHDLLHDEGFEVLGAFDGADARKQFFDNRDLSLAVVDLNLPGLDGWDVLEPITRLNPFVPVIVVTARPNQYQMANEAGVAALMEKPLDFPLLLTTMRKVLAEPPAERLLRLAGCRQLTQYLGWPT